MITIHRLLTFFTSMIAIVGLTACCANVQFGGAVPPPNPNAQPADPPPPKKPDDKPKPPPDPAAVALEKEKGHVVYDESQPDRPVIEVWALHEKSTDADFKKLVTFKKLRKLSIAQSNSGIKASPISGVGFKDLAHLQDLVELRANHCPITDDGVSHIVAFRKLKVLLFANAKFSDTAMKQIGTLDRLEEFAMYDVQGHGPNKNEPRDETIQLVGNFKNLRDLNVSYTAAGDLTCKAIAGLPLKKLSMYNTKITNTGMAELAKLKLDELTIGGYGMGDKGVEAFAGQTQMKSLQFAYASGVTDKSVKTLSTLTGLTYLSLFMTSITPQGVEDLKKALPKCKVSK